jgi:dihydrofolate reductase
MYDGPTLEDGEYLDNLPGSVKDETGHTVQMWRPATRRTSESIGAQIDVPGERPPGTVYEYVTDGIESALKQAQVAAGDKDVSIMGGADLGRQYVAAGLVDEISIHPVPVLFGTGTRMFEDLQKGHVRLEPVDVLSTPSATHLRYRIVT